MFRITRIKSVIQSYVHNKYGVFSSFCGRPRRNKKIPPDISSAGPPLINDDYAREELANRQGPEEMDRGMPEEEWQAYCKLAEMMTTIDVMG